LQSRQFKQNDTWSNTTVFFAIMWKNYVVMLD